MGILAGHTAFLIGTAIEGMLYGAYVALVGYAFMILTWRRRTDRVDWVLLTFLLSMLLAASVHHFFGLNALVVGFITHGGEANGPLNYLASKAVGYPMDILLGINLVLSDMTMLYRLWLVWQRRTLILVVPVLMMVAYLVTFVCAVNLMAHGGRDAAATYATIMRLCLTSFSLALVFSVTVTALLAYPIYTHTKAFAEALGQRQVAQYRSTILMLVESGAIIAVAQVVNVTVFEIQYRTGHNIWELIGLPLTQIYCIVPSLIIVRVGLGLSSDQRSTTGATTTRKGGRHAKELEFTSAATGATAVALHKYESAGHGVRVDQESVTKIDAGSADV